MWKNILITRVHKEKEYDFFIRYIGLIACNNAI